MSDPSDNPPPTRQAQWPRFVIEGVVIVASILLAFGIEAWWAERQERQEEQRLLQNLHAEFAETRELFAEGVRAHQDFRESATRLVDFEPSDRSLAANLDFFRVYVVFRTVYPKTGVLDGMLATGRLDLISSDELRSMLAAWPQTLNEYREDENFIVNWVGGILPSVAESVPLADLPSSPEAPESLDVPVSPSFIPFLTSQEGRSLATERSVYERFAVRDGELLIVAVDELIRLLELEIQ